MRKSKSLTRRAAWGMAGALKDALDPSKQSGPVKQLTPEEIAKLYPTRRVKGAK